MVQSLRLKLLVLLKWSLVAISSTSLLLMPPKWLKPRLTSLLSRMSQLTKTLDGLLCKTSRTSFFLLVLWPQVVKVTPMPRTCQPLLRLLFQLECNSLISPLRRSCSTEVLISTMLSVSNQVLLPKTSKVPLLGSLLHPISRLSQLRSLPIWVMLNHVLLSVPLLQLEKPFISLTGLSLELTCLHFHLFQLSLVELRPTSMFHLPLPAKPEDSPSQWS